jgi:hypothetical protein
VNNVGAQHNADSGRCYHRSVTPRSSTRIEATDQQLEAAILAALSDAVGEVVAWADLREKLPTATLWRKGEALVRLHQAGRLSVFKVAGRNYVDSIVLVAP